VHMLSMTAIVLHRETTAKSAGLAAIHMRPPSLLHSVGWRTTPDCMRAVWHTVGVEATTTGTVHTAQPTQPLSL
jgi:hypothetical protein